MLAIREQPSFAGGMWQSVAPERIPDDGAWNIENGLLDEDGSVNRRGGSQYCVVGDGRRPGSDVDLVGIYRDLGADARGGFAGLRERRVGRGDRDARRRGTSGAAWHARRC